MDRITGRPDHIEDAIMRMHTNSWFTWTDSKNKIYANLRLNEKIGVGGKMVDNPVTELPSEETVNAKLAELQADWDLEWAGYRNDRRKSYGKIADQLDQIYHDITAGKLDATGEWYKAIKKVKDDNPK
tara:strand:- start:9 stop:392 length:384 start_codon:yes stop_codon:yes gene_type:complete